MPDCLFCAIAAGDIPSARIHEDDRTFAFLDIHPLRPGHTLVIPKAHAARIQDADPEDLTAMMATTRRLLPALAAATGDPDATVAVNNGPAAGQEVPHLHVHLVPRAEDDRIGPIHALFDGHADMGQDAIGALARDIAGRLEGAGEAGQAAGATVAGAAGTPSGGGSATPGGEA